MIRAIDFTRQAARFKFSAIQSNTPILQHSIPPFFYVVNFL